MSAHLLLTFRFLAPWFHGRGDGAVPEWPPSPLRAFQALVAAAARAGTLRELRPALTWLEQQPPPLILAPEASLSSVGYRLSVPHNAMDLVGKQWLRGADGNPAEHRAMKDVRPHRLPEDTAVHYAWRLDGDDTKNCQAVIATARQVVALGWGIDLVVGDGAVIDGTRLSELRSGQVKTWEPRSDGGLLLRAPIAGSLEDLDRRHEAFLARMSLENPTFCPPPALSTFSITSYARSDEPPRRHVAAFTLIHPTADRMRAFDLTKAGMVVSGMLRHAVRAAATQAGWPEERVRSTVLGHGEVDNPRLLLVPVPSIEPRPRGGERVTEVRRVLLFSTDDRSPDVPWLSRALGGAELIDEKTQKPTAVLAVASSSDRAFARFIGESTTWATVTPVVLPGYDDPGGIRARLRCSPPTAEQRTLLDRLNRRREGLVRKALRHAGFADELVFEAQVEVRETGFFAGVDRASRFRVPEHLVRFPRLHVRITWPRRVRGPICVGRGRFSGLGLFGTC
jgi:CRISPR-associated protein Csb2